LVTEVWTAPMARRATTELRSTEQKSLNHDEIHLDAKEA
jgi:hypothetical protein